MNDNGCPPPDEIESVFKHALGVIRSALVRDCGLTGEEAAEAEGDLYTWFHRFVRRKGADQVPVRALRVSLLFAARQHGLTYRTRTRRGSSVDGTSKEGFAKKARDTASDLALRPDRGVEG